MITCVFLFTVFFLYLIHNVRKKFKYNLPPGPWGLPFVGYLPFMRNDPCKEFQELAKKYGDLFSVSLGRKLIVVATDVKIAKDLLNKPTAVDRPDNMFVFLPNGAGLAEQNGDVWHEQRRYSMMEMRKLGLGRSHWEKLIEMEVSDFINFLIKSQGQPIDVYDVLSAGVSNNVLSLITNHRLPVGHPDRSIIDRGIESFQDIYDQSSLTSNFPTLFKIFVKIGLIDAREKLEAVAKMSECLRKQIEDLRGHKDGDSYVHKYFVEIEKNKRLNLQNSFNESNLQGNVQALVMAGSDTTKIAILWLFLAMASYPDVQSKVHEELDTVVGKDGKADWTDRLKLPYCFATIHEGQRWRTIVPLNLLHRTSEDTAFNGYTIPRKTNIITALSAFHCDHRYWEDPQTFQPERFLSEDGKQMVEPEGFLAFSFGKRKCPGKTVALIEIFHYFVTTMQGFQILAATDGTLPDVEGVNGLTFHPKRQLLRFMPR